MNCSDELRKKVEHLISRDNNFLFDEAIVNAIAFHHEKGEMEDANEWLQSYCVCKCVEIYGKMKAP